MRTSDDFSSDLGDCLQGTCDCVDRISIRGYYPMGQTSGGFIMWWKNQKGKLVLRRTRNWPLVYHYHFHIVDRQWGHLTIRMSGHPPFGLQISLKGQEWVERKARAQGVPLVKQENCFVGGSDFPQVNQPAQILEGPKGLAQLAEVCERWVYCACLCFALDSEAQVRSGFRYQYSCYQLEYRRYRPQKPGVRKLAGLLVIREKVIHPVLAGVCRRTPGRPPKLPNPLDRHYQNLQKEMLATLQCLKLAA